MLNFGILGLNLDEVRSQYQLFASRWEPDVVLYFMWRNDLAAPFCGDLVWGRTATDQGVGKLANGLVSARIAYVLFDRYAGQQPASRPGYDLLRSGLTAFSAQSASNDAVLGLVILGSPLYGSEQEALERWLDDEGLPTLDLQFFLADERNRLPRDTHLSPRGHRLVANAVTEWLNSTSAPFFPAGLSVVTPP